MESGIRYARVGDEHIAYRTLGDGPIDLVVSLGFVSHIEHLLAEPRVRALFDGLAEISRVIMFDRRGVGLSDAFARAPTLSEQVEDVRAVLDAVGSKRAAIFGHTLGAPYALMFAASDPERISHVIVASGFARMTRTDDYPWANTREQRDAAIEVILENWGTGASAVMMAPSLAADMEFRDWYAGLERLSSGPGAMRKFFAMVGQIDIRPILPSVHQPVLVLHPPASVQFDPGHSRYLVDNLPNARFGAVPGADIIPVTAEARDFIGDEVEEFLTGSRPERRYDRALRTVLFTDIVESTERAARLGDRAWREVLDHHDQLVRRELANYQGREVKTTGDGFFATFEGPEHAVRCALAINGAVERAGVDVRSGVHTGECEVRGEDLGGLTVHIGARVAAKAESHEVLVSQTVRDLVVGSELTFDPRGEHELKGVPGTWELFAAAAGD